MRTSLRSLLFLFLQAQVFVAQKTILGDFLRQQLLVRDTVKISTGPLGFTIAEETTSVQDKFKVIFFDPAHMECKRCGDSERLFVNVVMHDCKLEDASRFSDEQITPITFSTDPKTAVGYTDMEIMYQDMLELNLGGDKMYIYNHGVGLRATATGLKVCKAFVCAVLTPDMSGDGNQIRLALLTDAPNFREPVSDVIFHVRGQMTFNSESFVDHPLTVDRIPITFKGCPPCDIDKVYPAGFLSLAPIYEALLKTKTDPNAYYTYRVAFAKEIRALIAHSPNIEVLHRALNALYPQAI